MVSQMGRSLSLLHESNVAIGIVPGTSSPQSQSLARDVGLGELGCAAAVRWVGEGIGGVNHKLRYRTLGPFGGQRPSSDVFPTNRPDNSSSLAQMI